MSKEVAHPALQYGCGGGFMFHCDFEFVDFGVPQLPAVYEIRRIKGLLAIYPSQTSSVASSWSIIDLKAHHVFSDWKNEAEHILREKML